MPLINFNVIVENKKHFVITICFQKCFTCIYTNIYGDGDNHEPIHQLFVYQASY